MLYIWVNYKYTVLQPMKKSLFLALQLFFCFNLFSAGGYITISSSVPSNMTICGNVKLFSFTITNPSPFTLTNVSANIAMPLGINYELLSVTNGTTSVSSPTNSLSFLLSNLAPNSNVTVTYSAATTCDVITFLNTGAPVESNITVNYLVGSTANFDNHASSSIMILQPNLSITSVTNQSYAGIVGSSFTRCITITNGGTGDLNSFSLTDTHGNGIAITAASVGSWTSTAGVDTYYFSGTNFSGFGNNNSIFESGESLTICETVSVTNCTSVNSSFNAYWGCSGQSCQNSISTANILFPNSVPNLVFTSASAISACMGLSTANQHTLTVVNTGLGSAVNALIKIYQSTDPVNYNSGLNSEIEVGSITIQIDGGAINTITPTSTFLNAGYTCLNPSPIGAVNLTIPTITPSSTVTIRFNTRACCSKGAFNGWSYSGDYYNACSVIYPITPTFGMGYNHLALGIINDDGSLSSIASGQSSTFSYITSGTSFNYPIGSDSYAKVTFTISPCLNYNPNSVRILDASSTNSYIPSNIIVLGNVVSATFTNAALQNLYSFDKAQIKIDLTANCGTCIGNGFGNVKVGIYYTTSQSCSCEIPLVVDSFPINVVCPVACEGLNFMNFSSRRTSFGQPDNDNNGLADAVGSLDFNKIKSNRAMFGDTVTTAFYGKIKTSLAHPTWQFCYANSTITNGNYLTSLGGRLRIYRQGLGLISTCTINSVTPTSPTATFNYDLSSNALISLGCVAVGFNYIDNDSLVFEPKYKVTTNIGGSTLDAAITNTFITSDIAAPTSTVNMFSCNTFQGKFSIVGYYYTTYAPESVTNLECNQVSVSNYYYLSVGPCCGNYAGGNMFPFEYRYWARIDTLKMTPPVGYKFIAANFNDTRTAGTGGGVTSPNFSLTPLNPLAPTWSFPVGSFFAGVTPSVNPSDDGFYGVLSATLEPSCVVTTNTIQPMGVGYDWIFKPSGFLPQDYNSNRQNAIDYDKITYTGPNIVLQAALTSINANNNVVDWGISLSNSSVVNANNMWLSAPAISGVSISTIVDVATNTTITPVGGIYQLGVLTAGDLKNYKLYGSYSTCTKDSIIIHAGWNCQGYPANLASYPCNTKQIILKETPLLPLIVSNVITPSYTVDLCDTASYEVIGTNVQLGSAYNLTVTVNIPIGSSIVPGSSELAYPASGSYTIIGNPTYIGGTLYQYNISALYPSITTNGLQGVLSLGNNTIKLKMKVTTACGYTAGSLASFSFFGKSACGASTGAPVSLSSQLGITGVSTPYYTNTALKTTYTSPCFNASTMNVKVKNISGSAFGSADSVEVTLPAGTNFVSGSFSGIHNPPSSGAPAISYFGATQHLTWELPTGVSVGDSTEFNFNYNGDASLLGCNISYFEAITRISTQALCVTTGSLCGVKVLTGGDTLPVFTYKSDLSLSNLSGYIIPNSPSGETALITFNINNAGQTLSNSYSTTISYYTDVNSNNIYDAGDVFISNHVIGISVLNNGSSVYTHSLNIPAGSACKIIAVLDTSVNHCSCSPSQLSIDLPIKFFANDAEICSGQTIQIGNASVTGYTYSWTPNNGNINSTSISNPIYSGTNAAGSAPITATYVLTVNRSNCIATDTAIVTVNPVITNSIVPITQTILCYGETATVTAITAGGVAPYNYTWQANSSTTNTALYTPGNYTMTVIDSENCGAGTQSIIVTQPTASLVITQYSLTTTCLSQNTGTVLVGINGGTPLYTIAWSNGSNDTLITNAAEGALSLIVTDNNGCEAFYNAVIVLNVCSEVSIPTIFTPNGDGTNDFFVIKNILEFPESVLSIYNRWGSLVYKKKNYDNSFDGKANVKNSQSNGMLPTGVYFIVLDFGSDLVKPYKGYIDLKY